MAAKGVSSLPSVSSYEKHKSSSPSMLLGRNLISISCLMVSFTDLLERTLVFWSGTRCPLLMLHPTMGDTQYYEERYANGIHIGISWMTCLPNVTQPK
jgi:hypothetical protein